LRKTIGAHRFYWSSPPSASEVADQWADQRANVLLVDAAALAAVDTEDKTG
jgi:hypothetical protein